MKLGGLAIIVVVIGLVIVVVAVRGTYGNVWAALTGKASSGPTADPRPGAGSGL